MPSEKKPLVLIAGATGPTGKSIITGLLESKNFRVAALIRPQSLEKPDTQELRASDVEIRPGDLTSDAEKLKESLNGVDILVTTFTLLYADQKAILQAAKAAGVKRVVPSEFGPYAPEGVMDMIDEKYQFRRLIQELQLPYTFIEVGWWLHYAFPFPHSIKPHPFELLNLQYVADGEKKVAHTSLKNIGKFVARILADPRTLNKTVFTWDVEVTQKESWALAEKVSGEDFSDYRRISKEEVFQGINDDPISRIIHQYINTLYIRGDNTVANAVAAGALDARKLYPDYVPAALEEEAVEFYKNPIRRPELVAAGAQ